MKRAVWGILALIWIGLCSAGAETHVLQTIKTTDKIPVFSVKPPHPQRGFFPAGVRLELVGVEGSKFYRVRLKSSSGKVIEGLCRKTDLGFSKKAVTAPMRAKQRVSSDDKRVPGSYYKESEWLEDYEGHKQAIKMQTKYNVPLLIFFYADWNDDCQGLWKGLLNSLDFKRVSKHFIKLRINPEHGKKEGQLANRYKLRRYPSTLVIDKLHAKPRRIDLCYYSFGKFRTMKPDKAVAEVMGVTEAVETTDGQTPKEGKKKGGWGRWK